MTAPVKPSAQIVQADTDVLLVQTVETPAGQEVQPGAPELEYEPTGQAVQAELVPGEAPSPAVA